MREREATKKTEEVGRTMTVACGDGAAGRFVPIAVQACVFWCFSCRLLRLEIWFSSESGTRPPFLSVGGCVWTRQTHWSLVRRPALPCFIGGRSGINTSAAAVGSVIRNDGWSICEPRWGQFLFIIHHHRTLYLTYTRTWFCSRLPDPTERISNSAPTGH